MLCITKTDYGHYNYLVILDDLRRRTLPAHSQASASQISRWGILCAQTSRPIQAVCARDANADLSTAHGATRFSVQRKKRLNYRGMVSSRDPEWQQRLFLSVFERTSDYLCFDRLGFSKMIYLKSHPPEKARVGWIRFLTEMLPLARAQLRKVCVCVCACVMEGRHEQTVRWRLGHLTAIKRAPWEAEFWRLPTRGFKDFFKPENR